MNVNDSMAMWKLYANTREAVAITTTTRRLARALEWKKFNEIVSMHKVEYVKHWRDPEIKINPYSRVFAYKHVAYDYEREVRLVLDRYDAEPLRNEEFGVALPVDTKALLRSVVIAPESLPWFRAVVESICENFDCEAPIKKSRLATKPI